MAGELCFEPVTDEAHCLVVRAGHPLLEATRLDLAALAQQAWIVPPTGSVVRDRITALFVSEGLEEPAEMVSTMALPVATALLMASDMVAPMSLELVKPQLDSGLLAVLPFDLSLRMDVYGFITRRQHQLSPAAEAMLGALREAVNRRR
jgi:DNA-binding transcriptional LysR family regulator